jgi:cytochrome c-type biogenesis protein CcmF
MDYTGEHLLPGLLGHFFIILSLVASLAATFAYFKTTQSKNGTDAAFLENDGPRSLYGRGTICFCRFRNSFLYHLQSSLRIQIRLAAQQPNTGGKVFTQLFLGGPGRKFSVMELSGIAVLGSILIRKARNWEAPVMTVVSFAQVCLGYDDRWYLFSSTGVWVQIHLCFFETRWMPRYSRNPITFP